MRTIMLWGYGVEDYQRMFDLTDDELNKPILEFGSGPSAFNAEQTAAKHPVTSCCPLFNLDIDTLKVKANLIFHEKCETLKKHADALNVDTLIKTREAGMQTFMKDYVAGKAQGRYQAVNDKQLPFADFSFNLALSAHYFFEDLEEQDTQFHIDMFKELARVATEVRIYPLVDDKGNMSSLLGPVLLGLQQAGYGVEIRQVRDELSSEGNAMLRVWAETCSR